MKFSVVITTYNRVSLLRRAVDSAINQTIPCEVIVADDCSADDTQAYVESLGNRVIYHRHEVNKGHAATVNTGVNQASGDWIKFLDDDDYLATNCIEEMAKAIALCPSAVICSCVAAQVDEHGVELSRTPQLGNGLAFSVPQADIHYGMLLELLPFGTPVQVACSRDAFCQTDGWDSQLDANCDDIDSWLRIAQFGDAIYLNQCLAYRTIWPGAYNHKFSVSKRLDTNILIKEKIYALVNEKHRHDLPKIEDIKKYLILHWAFVELKQKNVPDFLMMLNKSAFSTMAWRTFLTTVFLRRLHFQSKLIRKIVLY
ncbi:glycosyl transferase family protein [Nostoc sp. HK-01]|uniref:Glycosyl transferase family protein n=1 Tax=Anabaenopsis circularis NIES-21 TaxID=1085406 RepID=A0A1Z4GGX9_9CYAN|nr:glycosyl transferase family protein [Anabaenopsis circularis NIES-21]BBD59157.1 glycosyl transferase family protein [Nostoc sp. HK-01]